MEGSLDLPSSRCRTDVPYHASFQGLWAQRLAEVEDPDAAVWSPGRLKMKGDSVGRGNRAQGLRRFDGKLTHLVRCHTGLITCACSSSFEASVGVLGDGEGEVGLLRG
jgi:hypothetical protein